MKLLRGAVLHQGALYIQPLPCLSVELRLSLGLRRGHLPRAIGPSDVLDKGKCTRCGSSQQEGRAVQTFGPWFGPELPEKRYVALACFDAST